MNYAFRGGRIGHRNCWGAALHMDQALISDTNLSQKNACLYAVNHMNTTKGIDVFPQADIQAFLNLQ